MGLFNQMPYTNFHELNIDWVLKVIKQTETEMNNLTDTITQIVEGQLGQTVETVDKAIAEIRQEMSQLQQSVDKQLADNVEYVDSEVAKLTEKVTTQITELTAYVNETVKDLENTVNNTVTELETKVETIRSELIADNADLKEWVYQHTAVYDEIIRTMTENYTDALQRAMEQIQALFQQLSDSNHALYEELVIRMDACKAELLAHDEEVYNRVPPQIKNLQDQIDKLKLGILPTELVNPVNYHVEESQDVIDSMYYNLKTWALTAEQYDSLGLTAEQYDSFGLTAYQYDYLGLWYLIEKPSLHNGFVTIWSGSDGSMAVTVEVEVPYFGHEIDLIYDVNTSGVLTSVIYNFVDTVDSLQHGAQYMYNNSYTPDVVSLTVQAVDGNKLKMDIHNAGATGVSPLVKIIMR